MPEINLKCEVSQNWMLLIMLRLGQKSELSVKFIMSDIRPKMNFQNVRFLIIVRLGPETPCTSH